MNVRTSHMSDIRQMSIAMQWLVDFISIVVTTPVLLCSNVLLVTMEMKSTSHCIATDIYRISLMWEVLTSSL
jgi:hypothetical protein